MNEQALMMMAVLGAASGLIAYILKNHTPLPDQLATDVQVAAISVAAYFAPGLGAEFALGSLGLGVARRIERTASAAKPGSKKTPGS